MTNFEQSNSKREDLQKEFLSIKNDLMSDPKINFEQFQKLAKLTDLYFESKHISFMTGYLKAAETTKKNYKL